MRAKFRMIAVCLQEKVDLMIIIQIIGIFQVQSQGKMEYQSVNFRPILVQITYFV